MPRKILIVEDETNIADLINLYLKKEGYETMVANDGGKALELYRLFRPDLVLRATTAIAKPRVALRRNDDRDSVAYVNPDLYLKTLRQRNLW